MELYSGHQCAAYRIPENTYACIGNDAMLGLCAPEFSLYVPIRADATDIPAVLANGAVTYDIYWQQRNIMNMAAVDREAYSSLVRTPFAALEQQRISRMADLQKGDPNAVLAETTETAEDTIHQATASLITRWQRTPWPIPKTWARIRQTDSSELKTDRLLQFHEAACASSEDILFTPVQKTGVKICG